VQSPIRSIQTAHIFTAHRASQRVLKKIALRQRRLPRHILIASSGRFDSLGDTARIKTLVGHAMRHVDEDQLRDAIAERVTQ
jgi:hypothetical protein